MEEMEKYLANIFRELPTCEAGLVSLCYDVYFCDAGRCDMRHSSAVKPPAPLWLASIGWLAGLDWLDCLPVRWMALPLPFCDVGRASCGGNDVRNTLTRIHVLRYLIREILVILDSRHVRRFSFRYVWLQKVIVTITV